MQWPSELILPDLFSLTPFAWDGPNPLFSIENTQSTEWMLSYGVFADYREAKLKAANAELLGAYAFPYADAKALRIIGDFHMVLFALDEITDLQDAEGAKATQETFIRALTGKSGDDKSPVTLFTRDFLKRLSEITSEKVVKRFISRCIDYIDATAIEAALRANNELLSIEDYTRLRRDNGGVTVCFILVEAALGITLPDEVFEDAIFMSLFYAGSAMIGWSNDVYSYAVERAQGLEGANAVTILMKSKGLSLQEAADHVAEIYEDYSDTFVSCKKRIRSYGPEADKAIQKYIYGLEQWIYANLAWSFDMERYFGEAHEEVKRTGIVKLEQRKP